MDSQDDRIVEEDIEINEKDRRISEFQNRLIRQNYQKYIQGKMGNQEWNLDINNSQRVPEEPENLNQSQQENFKLGSSFYSVKNQNGQISENQDEIDNLEIKKQKNDDKQQEEQTFQVQNLDSLANSVDMIKQTNGSDYQTSSEKSQGQGKIQKESNFSLLDLQKEQSQILVKEDMDLVGMRNQIKNEQLQFNPNDSQYQSEIKLFPTIQNPFSSRLYYLDNSLNDMLNSVIKYQNNEKKQDKFYLNVQESANKEDQDEIFMNNMIFGKTFTEERGFYNFVYKNKKKSKRNRAMQQMAQDGYNKSISHIIPHLKQSRLGTSSQMTNTNYKNYSMYDQIVMDKSVSSFGHKGGSQLQANKTIVQGGSSEEVLTYRDFLTFLRHDKTIRNLIPLYILSGLFYGFWQKLGPIVVQFTKQEKMNIMYKNIYDDTGVIFIISGIVQFFLGPIFGYTFDLANAKWKKRIMALLLIICFIALALFPLPFIDTQAFYHTDDKRTGQIIFTLIGVLFGIFNCGVNTTGGPIRSGAFKSERRLVLSFATYRLVYFASIAVSFFCTLGVPYSVIPFVIPVILLIFAIISVKTILFNHKY
ncbi:Major facilitator superfamily domain, general substrate transporter [Pseudocohnilembus persalinus]|uniref:Major facilitator superfamily domain, general substrate transporter n=1 Tax=Pseudocohnilembus persalinus TaxID=266149 RepID=A0A0V0Q7X6_PSEPJ|nr:Major facilitator superfamily domain, general substrate transporter [Pseudocohnilembus persalinus]|eukprot:KRW98266.1 Major facilitator superfamily domain, general substrate transporter [Pseudocohnilembus persalinus]